MNLEIIRGLFVAYCSETEEFYNIKDTINLIRYSWVDSHILKVSILWIFLIPVQF